MSAWLDAADLYRLTGKKRYGAQCRVLTARGIPFAVAESGEPLVKPDQLDAKQKPERNRGPNWDRIAG